MNIFAILKAIPVVLSFLASQKDNIEKLVLDAEAKFPQAQSGISKLAHVLGGVFTLVQDTGGLIAQVPQDILGLLLTGHISQVVTKILPPATQEQAKAAGATA